MSNNKLTPCRTVGLSRKKSTPITLGISNQISVESIQTTKTTHLAKDKTTSKSSQKADCNVTTPCRRVGLSRKRKISSLNSSIVESNVSTSSTEENKKSSIKEIPKIISHDTEENYSIPEIIEATKNPKVENLKKCDKIPTVKNEKNTENLQLISDSKLKASKSLKSKETTEDEKSNKNVPKHKKTKIKKSPKNSTTKLAINDKEVNISTEQNISTAPLKNDILDKYKTTHNFNMSPQRGNQFIKVCYKTDEPSSSDSETLINLVHKKTVKDVPTPTPIIKKKKLRMFDDDDDDFETPHLSQSKATFRRCETDISKFEKQKKKDLHLRKSVSLTCSNESPVNGCFIKLDRIDGKLNNLLNKPIVSPIVVIDVSDDEFDTAAPIPKEQVKENIKYLEKEVKEKRKTLDVSDDESGTASPIPKEQVKVNIEYLEKEVKEKRKTLDVSDDEFGTAAPIPKEQVKENIEYLEKEVKEKRKTLEELIRAKSLRKLHDVEELRNLTLTWKSGCKVALSDLLIELNKHAVMSMETLVKKFNIPPDFLPLSQ